jgi:hypothetical protein
MQHQTPPTTPTTLKIKSVNVFEGPKKYVPNKELNKCCGLLLNLNGEGIKVELEEYARCANAMLKFPNIIRDTVLVGSHSPSRPCRLVFGRDDAEEILIRGEMMVRQLVAIVEWLDDGGKIGPKGEFRDYMGQIHD